jgi:hypothetical protein
MTQPPKPSLSPPLLAAYGVIIRTTTEAIQRAFRTLTAKAEAIRSDSSEHTDDTLEECFDAIVVLLANAAALSRVFWPHEARVTRDIPPEKRARRKAQQRTRGAEFRAWFLVADDSPLNEEGRNVRNTFEHWDEKVIDWVPNVVGQVVHDATVTDRRAPQPGQHYIRSYNSRTRTITYGDESLDLGPLLGEVDRVVERYWQVKPELGLPTHSNPILGG